MVTFDRDGMSKLRLPERYGLVGCKAEEKRVDSVTLRAFGTKCGFHRTQFGILIASSNVTGGRTSAAHFADQKAAEPRTTPLPGRRGYCSLFLSGQHLEGTSTKLRGLEEPLLRDCENVVFGPVA